MAHREGRKIPLIADPLFPGRPYSTTHFPEQEFPPPPSCWNIIRALRENHPACRKQTTVPDPGEAQGQDPRARVFRSTGRSAARRKSTIGGPTRDLLHCNLFDGTTPKREGGLAAHVLHARWGITPARKMGSDEEGKKEGETSECEDRGKNSDRAG